MLQPYSEYTQEIHARAAVRARMAIQTASLHRRRACTGRLPLLVPLGTVAWIVVALVCSRRGHPHESLGVAPPASYLQPSTKLYPAQCALLEGRAATSTHPSACAALSADVCERFYVVDSERQRFRLCVLVVDLAQPARGMRANPPLCAASTSELSCDLLSGLIHAAELRQALQRRAETLRDRAARLHITSTFSSRRLALASALAEAAVACAEVFELAIARDAALSVDSLEAMLRYQVRVPHT